MGIFNKIFGKKSMIIEFSSEELIDAGACPNCWGQQEYANQYIDYAADATKSNINHDKAHKKAFIQQFVETNVTGIRLKKDGENLHCPSCQVKFKYS